jgi:hypothetical protein
VRARVPHDAAVAEAPPLKVPVTADVNDDKFIACTLAADCPLIVGADHHLLDVNCDEGIEGRTPRASADGYLNFGGPRGRSTLPIAFARSSSCISTAPSHVATGRVGSPAPVEPGRGTGSCRAGNMSLARARTS